MTETLSPEPVQAEPKKPDETADNSPAPFKVGLNEAARLTGASKTTILKYAEEGKLSFEFNGAQKKVYQVAELQRVFGDLKIQTSSTLEQKNQVEPNDTAIKLAVLEEKLHHAEEIARLYQQQAERAEQEADNWRLQAERATLMLTHRPEPTATAAPEQQDAAEPQPPAPELKKGFLSGIFGGRR